jgi:NADPH:quinone reductase-like Zn-dependent oxidoreductase
MAREKKMKAIIFTQYGSPDVLQLAEVEKPTPTENQVLVKVQAAAANPLDWRRLRADPFLVRLDGGLFKPKNPKLGADLAGIVEAAGRNVTDFKPGKVGMMGTAKPNKADLLVIKELLETGQVVPVIDRYYPLAETAAAHRYMTSRPERVIRPLPKSAVATAGDSSRYIERGCMPLTLIANRQLLA